MKVIVAGSRGIWDYRLVKEAIDLSPFKDKITTIISGRARGVDELGEAWARDNSIPILPYPANWTKHGLSAGYKRNLEMADVADGLIAIWDGKSKGTRHMIEIAKAKGLEVFVYYTS